MAVYKEENTNTWRVLYRYTDWNGEQNKRKSVVSKQSVKHRLGNESNLTKWAVTLI